MALAEADDAATLDEGRARFTRSLAEPESVPASMTVAVVQIAGLIARRILCAAREGEAVVAGDRFGIIRFGSRTDTYLPEGVRPVVAVGQTMIGGETVMAFLGP